MKNWVGLGTKAENTSTRHFTAHINSRKHRDQYITDRGQHRDYRSILGWGKITFWSGKSHFGGETSFLLIFWISASSHVLNDLLLGFGLNIPEKWETLKIANVYQDFEQMESLQFLEKTIF